ncbi:MAG: ThuA domain-containing protein [Bacteroidota bacterium]
MNDTTLTNVKFLIALCCFLNFLFGSVVAQSTEDHSWIVYQGEQGPGQGKHIVLVSGDEEYRSEEALPMLAKILAYRHGFKCTVLFAINPETGKIDPDYQKNIPGLETLKDADLMVLFTRFRELPRDQMEHILNYVEAGKPTIGMRTATHAFRFPEDSPYQKYSFNSKVTGWEGGFGRQVLGETWISHHGHHGQESTRGLVNGLVEDHPVLKGVKDVWGPTDVYGITEIEGEETVLLYGQSLLGMTPESLPNFDKSVVPIAWIKNYETQSGESCRVFNTTMGAAVDLESSDLRRLIVNATYWCMGLEEQIPEENNVALVGEYEPTFFGFGDAQQGLSPADFAVDQQTVEQAQSKGSR